MACGNAESGWGSPRFSFSVNLSSTDIASPEKRKLKDLLDLNYSTEFEFLVASNMNVNADLGEPLKSADDLFADGKILPQFPSLQPQTIKIAQFSSHPRPNQKKSASKLGRKLSARWMRFLRLENHEHFRTISKEADANENESSCPKVKPQRFRKFVSLFSRSSDHWPCCKDLFCVFPFQRDKSEAQNKSVESQIASKETQTLVSGSKPAAAAGLKNGGLMEVEDSPQSNR
ncbi:hypothetical protein SUGI_0121370 [Cryptomeria japonica]|uniref:uncharacterized protein LOC131071331 n=1 Tax=Cryptomeria japonica TaxID=3369 RepID=UPI002408B606|nr:uncharacterized protein LOC131071331 [Cryptomeria japonica]GLJ10071.1 hypothetical protein SUGI_0121370 [Cryptomeria japonica]